MTMPMRAPCILLSLLTSVSIVAVGHAQAAAVGVLLGLSRDGASGDSPPNTSYSGGFGLVTGLQAEIGLSQSIALSIQPMFSQHRTTLTSATDDDASDEMTLDLKLDYISVPLVVKFSAAGGRTYVAGGVDLGFIQSARIAGDGIDEDIKDYFNSVDVGALFGFGVVFPLGRPSLTTELRYVQGLTNLSNDSGTGVLATLPGRFHSGGFQLTAGILFPIGKK